ncbi:MAG: chemotaxis protein CheW [Acidobacteria bacterium]|nr:chemotaxis protein CheW [Acidobacteriota bacterium]
MAQKVVPWVLIRLDASVLGIESSSVREMLLLPRTTAIPKASPEIRGVITLRNRAIPVVDLRRLLGMPSLGEDAAKLNALLVQHAEDHRRWLAELEASVKENREFKLTLDPHQCAFGRWYDAFKPTSVVLESHLKRFDHPHKEIHALGHTVGGMVKAGRFDEAHALIDQAHRGTLATLMQLFDETPKILAEMNREMVIVLRDDHCVVSVTADAVESVEAIRPDTVAEIQLPNGSRGSGPVTRTARTAKTDKLILILDARHLLSEFSNVPVPAAAPGMAHATAA